MLMEYWANIFESMHLQALKPVPNPGKASNLSRRVFHRFAVPTFPSFMGGSGTPGELLSRCWPAHTSNS